MQSPGNETNNGFANRLSGYSKLSMMASEPIAFRDSRSRGSRNPECTSVVRSLLIEPKQREELRKLLRELWDCPGEERTSHLFEEINQLVVDPNWSDYIYWSDEFVTNDEGLDVDGLIQRLDEYKPIQL